MRRGTCANLPEFGQLYTGSRSAFGYDAEKTRRHNKARGVRTSVPVQGRRGQEGWGTGHRRTANSPRSWRLALRIRTWRWVVKRTREQAAMSSKG